MYLVNLKPSSVAVHTKYRVTSLLVPCDSGRLGTLISLISWNPRTSLLMPGGSGRLGTFISLISVEYSRRNDLVLLNLSSEDCTVCVLNNAKKKNMKLLYSVSAQLSFLS